VNGFTVKSTPRWSLALVALAFAWVLAGHRSAVAATVNNSSLTSRDAKAFASWTYFLSGGVHRWATTRAPAFTPAVRSTIWTLLRSDSQSQALGNPMIEYLLWKRSLDPTRFATNHPNLSPVLAGLLRTSTLPTPPINLSPSTFSAEPQTTNLPQTGASLTQNTPAVIPEPGTLILAISMTGWAVWHRRKLCSC
jgi:hypothetical protein